METLAGVNDSLSAFKDAFTRVEQVVTPDDSYAFQSTTLEDVLKAAQTIQQDQAKRWSLRNMARLAPLLQSLEKYSEVVDVMCRATPYLPLIWVSCPAIVNRQR
jgi:hypothetical protein